MDEKYNLLHSAALRAVTLAWEAESQAHFEYILHIEGLGENFNKLAWAIYKYKEAVCDKR